MSESVSETEREREREKAEMGKCESEPHCEAFAWGGKNREIHFFELSLLERIARNRFVQKNINKIINFIEYAFPTF